MSGIFPLFFRLTFGLPTPLRFLAGDLFPAHHISHRSRQALHQIHSLIGTDRPVDVVPLYPLRLDPNHVPDVVHAPQVGIVDNAHTEPLSIRVVGAVVPPSRLSDHAAPCSTSNNPSREDAWAAHTHRGLQTRFADQIGLQLSYLGGLQSGFAGLQNPTFLQTKVFASLLLVPPTPSFFPLNCKHRPTHDASHNRSTADCT